MFDCLRLNVLEVRMHFLGSEVVKMFIYNVISIATLLMVAVLPIDFLEKND